MVYDEQVYAGNVLGRAPKNKLRASLLWLIEGDAIPLAQADRLEDLYAHRHDPSHELIEYMVDPDFEPDVELSTDALTILKATRRFWTSIEKDIGSSEDFGDVDLDEVTPLSLAVLQMCIDAYVAGSPASELGMGGPVSVGPVAVGGERDTESVVGEVAKAVGEHALVTRPFGKRFR